MEQLVSVLIPWCDERYRNIKENDIVRAVFYWQKSHPNTSYKVLDEGVSMRIPERYIPELAEIDKTLKAAV